MASSKRRLSRWCSRRRGWPRGRRLPASQGQVEAVDGVEEEEGAHALVEVVAGAAEAVEGLAFGEQFGERQIAAEGVQRSVARLAAAR